MELILKPGDPCPDCQQLGQTKHLRYFYINVDEQILKCETETCLYPYNDEISTDSESGDDSKSNTQNLDLQFSDGLLLLEELLNDSGTGPDTESKFNMETSPSRSFTHETKSSAKVKIESVKNIEIIVKEEKRKMTTNSNGNNNNNTKTQSKSKRAAPAKPESTTVNKKSKLQQQQQQQQQQAPPTAPTKAIEIPKASISRYFAAINTRAQNKSKMPAKKRQGKPTKKTSKIELEVTKKVAMPNPLAEVLKLINKKSTT